MKKLLAVITLLLVTSLYGQSSDNRRDGNWWKDQSMGLKLDYVVGFFDGIQLGSKFSYWGFVYKDPSCESKVYESYDSYMKKYLAGVTNDQLVDGLDAFYSDYRNRRIRVANAVWLVVNGIAGKSQKDLDKMIESWRGNSSD